MTLQDHHFSLLFFQPEWFSVQSAHIDLGFDFIQSAYLGVRKGHQIDFTSMLLKSNSIFIE